MSTKPVPHSNGASLAQKVHIHGAKGKEKTRKLLHLPSSSTSSSEDDEYHAAMDKLSESPAFNSSRFLHKARIGTSGVPEKTIAILHGAVEFILYPKTAMNAKAIKKTAGSLAKSNPYLSRKADLDFLDAHDNLTAAEGDGDKCGSDDEESAAIKRRNIVQCEDKVSEMEKMRQEMRVAWITARHIQRVRVVGSTVPAFLPDSSHFEQPDDCGIPKLNWGKYIAYNFLYISRPFTVQYIDDFEHLPFDVDALRKAVERLVIYGYMIYSTIMNYCYPTPMEQLREGIEWSIDRGATAFKIGELMDKHGSDDWLGPLMEDLGPHIQVQVADLASLLEASYNFYHFRNPFSTIASLCLASSIFAICLLGDADFAPKVLWFVVGIGFFVCWPISSHYPKYRIACLASEMVLLGCPKSCRVVAPVSATTCLFCEGGIPQPYNGQPLESSHQ